MLTSALRALLKNLVKENFYRKKKTINILTALFIYHKSDVKIFLKWILKIFFPFGCVRIGRNVRPEITRKGEINNKSLNFEVFTTADHEEKKNIAKGREFCHLRVEVGGLCNSTLFYRAFGNCTILISTKTIFHGMMQL